MSLRDRLKDLVAVRRLPADTVDRVLLTFDDGPHPEGTPAVLDVLARYNARAVFFVVGSRIPRAPEMLTRIVAAGHLIGNHSYAHPLKRQFGLREYVRDIFRCQAAVEDLTGIRPRLFRPPLGHVSAASMIAPRRAGLRPVLWSVDSDDWRMRSAGDIDAHASRLAAHLSHPALREIVLLHDESMMTADLLQQVLPGLTARGVGLRPDLGFIGGTSHAG